MAAPRKRLALRLTLSFLIPTTLGFVTLGLLADLFAQRTAEEQLSEHLISVGEGTRAMLRGYYYTDLIARVDTANERARASLRARILSSWRETGVRRIFVFTPEGKSIADTRDSVAFGDPYYVIEADTLEIQDALSGKSRSSVLYHAEDGTPYKYAYIPIFLDKGAACSQASECAVGAGCVEGLCRCNTDAECGPSQRCTQPPAGTSGAGKTCRIDPSQKGEGEVIAVIAVEGSSEQIAEIDALRGYLVMLGAAGIVLVALVSIIASRRITQPLQELVGAARNIGQGDLEHAIAVTRDDELGDLQRSLDEMRLALLDRDEQMQMMLSGIAHEVRNPLGGMELFLGLLEEDLIDEGRGDDDPLREHVTKVHRELMYLSRVVQEFLEFARRSRIETMRFRARPFMDEIAQVMEGDLMIRGIHLELTLEPEEIELTGDRDRLRRVVINLLRNAWQASPEGSTLRLSVSEHEGTREIVVQDEGAGIPEAKLADILKPFFTTREKGTGLGLPLAQKVMEAHRGTLSIASVEGEGTTVTLVWPFREDLEPESMDSEMVIPEGWLG